MPRLVEMGTLLERCQRRADKYGDDFILDPEWRALISEVWGADVFQVVADTGFRHFETTSDLVTTGAAYVSEPTNFAKSVRLDYVDSAGRHYELAELSSYDEGKAAGRTTTGSARFFALVDNRIYLYPAPPTGQTYQLLYTPQAPDVSAYASDECVDLVSADGEACVVWGVAAIAKVKASQDGSYHAQKAAQHRDRLMAWAADRATMTPRARVTDWSDIDRGIYDPADYRWSR